MTALTTDQIDTLAIQDDAIDATFVNIATILKDKALDRNIRTRLVKIATMLNRASNMLNDLLEVDGEGEEPKAPKKARAPKKAKAAKKPKTVKVNGKSDQPSA